MLEVQGDEKHVVEFFLNRVFWPTIETCQIATIATDVYKLNRQLQLTSISYAVVSGSDSAVSNKNYFVNVTH